MRQFTNKGIEKTFLWPLWFPFPICWLKSVFLCLLLTGVFYLIGIIAGLNYQGFKSFADNPELLTILMILALLLPIPVIAFGQEIFLLFLMGFLRKVPPAPNQSVLPGLMSWWEGLYSWLVFIISSLIVTAILEITLPIFNLGFGWFWEPESVSLKVGIIVFFWLIVAASFYQVEFLFKRSLIETSLINYKKSYSIGNQLKEERLESGDNRVKQEIESVLLKKPKNSESKYVFNLRQFTGLLFQKFLIPLIIILGVFRSYSLSPVPEVSKTFDPMGRDGISAFPITFPWFVSNGLFCQKTQEIVTTKPSYSNFDKNPINSEAPLPVPYVPPLPPKPSKIKIQAPPMAVQFDPFQQAVYRATTAANLAQLAKTEVEWKGVSRQWQDAIKLMEAVPVDSPQYTVAQKKVKEYQQNLIYAQKAAGIKDKDIGG